MGKYRSTKVGQDITSDQDSAINHFVSNTLSFIALNGAYNKNLQMDVIKKTVLHVSYVDNHTMIHKNQYKYQKWYIICSWLSICETSVTIHICATV